MPSENVTVAPRFHPQMSEQDRKNERRLADRIAAALTRTPLIGKSFVRAAPLHGGKTSTVYKLTASDETLAVLKLAGDIAFMRTEAAALSCWRALGINTPEVLDVGEFSGEPSLPYLLLEFIEGENLLGYLESQTGECKNIQRDLGAIQARLHQFRVQGFGEAVWDGVSFRGTQTSFRAELAESGFEDVLAFARTDGRIEQSDLARIESATRVLESHAESCGTRLLHTDFRAGNILYSPNSKRIYTVIDPSAVVSHPYMCLSYSLVLTEIHGRSDPIHILEGYEQIERVDRSALSAARLLRAILMLRSFGRDKTTSYAKGLQKVIRCETDV